MVLQCFESGCGGIGWGVLSCSFPVVAPESVECWVLFSIVQVIVFGGGLLGQHEANKSLNFDVPLFVYPYVPYLRALSSK